MLWTSVLTYLVLSVDGGAGLGSAHALIDAPSASAAGFAIILTEQVLYICALGLVVSMMGSIFSSVPRALERFDIVSYLSVPAGVGQLLLNLLLLYLGYSIRGLVIGGVVIQSLVLVAYIGVARHLLRPLGRPVLGPAGAPPINGFRQSGVGFAGGGTDPGACREIYHWPGVDTECRGVLQRPLQSGVVAYVYSRQRVRRTVSGLLALDGGGRSMAADLSCWCGARNMCSPRFCRWPWFWRCSAANF